MNVRLDDGREVDLSELLSVVAKQEEFDGREPLVALAMLCCEQVMNLATWREIVSLLSVMLEVIYVSVRANCKAEEKSTIDSEFTDLGDDIIEFVDASKRGTNDLDMLEALLKRGGNGLS